VNAREAWASRRRRWLLGLAIAAALALAAAAVAPLLPITWHALWWAWGVAAALGLAAMAGMLAVLAQLRRRHQQAIATPPLRREPPRRLEFDATLDGANER
jgi:peptidoglycan/LPS O-acetylase OafA/YrhL